MLEVVQPNHQAHGLGRGAIGVSELGAELVLEDGSVDLVGEKDQRVVGVDKGFGAKQSHSVTALTLRPRACTEKRE